MKAILKVAILPALLLALASVANAETLTLTGTGSNTVNTVEYGGGYTYPYYLSVNDGPSVAMMCLSFDNEISQGESWYVTESTPTSVDQLEAAWLFEDAAATPANDIADQLAAWSLFATEGSSLLAYDSPAAAGQLALAGANYGSVNAANFTIYTPDGYELNIPQTFITETTTPEPSSLLLLGTGLFGLAVILFRKMKAFGHTTHF